MSGQKDVFNPVDWERIKLEEKLTLLNDALIHDSNSPAKKKAYAFLAQNLISEITDETYKTFSETQRKKLSVIFHFCHTVKSNGFDDAPPEPADFQLLPKWQQQAWIHLLSDEKKFFELSVLFHGTDQSITQSAIFCKPIGIHYQEALLSKDTDAIKNFSPFLTERHKKNIA